MAKTPRRGILLLLVVTLGSMLGIAGTDMVLPSLPYFPADIGGTVAEGQMVVATYGAGIALGLLIFGQLAGHFTRAGLMLAALLLFSLCAVLIAGTSSVPIILGARFAQGVVSAAPAVFAAGIIRTLYDDTEAAKVIGLLSSLEVLAPAGAPALGLWFYSLGGWPAAFWGMAALGFGLTFILFIYKKGEAPHAPRTAPAKLAGYRTLLTNAVYMRYATAQAATLAGLLVIVFTGPVVIVKTMGGSNLHFIAMQVCGIATFILAINISPRLAPRFGAERIIFAGTALAFLAAFAIAAYGFMGAKNPLILIALYVPLNLGLGIRGPLGFLTAIQAGLGNDDKASSLLTLMSMGFPALATALTAPYVADGLLIPALACLALEALALGCLIFLPPLKQN